METIIDQSHIISKPVKVTFLEMREAPQASVEHIPGISCKLLPKPISTETYRRFYYGVGEKYHWLDRMVMPEEELEKKINAPNTEIFVLHADDQPAGFAEFVVEKDYTEILYFGLLPAFVGKGLGGWFLQWVIQHAWSYKPSWIQVNTCALDHPNALPVYKKSGFKEVRTEVQDRRVLT